MPAFDPAAFDVSFDEAVSTTGLLVGFDPFDGLMNKVCSVLTNRTSTTDGYGQRQLRPEDFISLADNIPCRISEKSIGRPHERQTMTNLSMNPMTFFMRPPSLSDGSNLTPHHWLKTTGTYDAFTGIVTPFADEDIEYWNITVVENPSELDHHLEVRVEELIP